MKAETAHQVHERLAQAERLRLFLDYDGTLADFAPTPEHVNPDPELVDLIGRLARHPRFRVAVVSGRRLGHVQKLVPVPGVLLAGTYGVELQTPEGERIDRLDYDRVRPTLDALKPRWAALIAGRQGFFLEDKGWALALHARFAAEDEADQAAGRRPSPGRRGAEAGRSGAVPPAGRAQVPGDRPPAGAQGLDGRLSAGPVPLARGAAPLPGRRRQGRRGVWRHQGAGGHRRGGGAGAAGNRGRPAPGIAGGGAGVVGGVGGGDGRGTRDDGRRRDERQKTRG